MIDEIRKLVDQYGAWLRDRTALRQVGDGWVEVTTPYLDRHNDYLQIYVRRDSGGYLLTDDGYIISDLQQCGCSLESPKRQQILKMTVAGFGVQLRDGVLQVRTSSESFPFRKHDLVQTMLAVNDMFCMAEPNVASLFCEDVQAWLEAHDVRYTPGVKFTGRSGYNHHFDFVIPKSRHQPERIVQAITNPTRETAEMLAFTWVDTREVRTPDSQAYALLNDGERKVSSGVVEALRSYDVQPVVWSQRDAVISKLAA